MRKSPRRCRVVSVVSGLQILHALDPDALNPMPVYIDHMARWWTGDPLWHAGVRTNVSNGPITYTLDGLQYVMVGAGDTLWAFVMNE